jgi:hypothetical protein
MICGISQAVMHFRALKDNDTEAVQQIFCWLCRLACSGGQLYDKHLQFYTVCLKLCSLAVCRTLHFTVPSLMVRITHYLCTQATTSLSVARLRRRGWTSGPPPRLTSSVNEYLSHKTGCQEILKCVFSLPRLCAHSMIDSISIQALDGCGL